MNLPPPKSRRLRPPRGRAPAAAGPVRAAEAEVRRAAGVRGEHDGAGCVVVPGGRGVPDVRRAARHRVPLRGGGGALQGAAAAIPDPRVTSATAFRPARAYLHIDSVEHCFSSVNGLT